MAAAAPPGRRPQGCLLPGARAAGNMTRGTSAPAGERGCRPPVPVVIWPQMSPSPSTSAPRDPGTSALLDAMETAPAAIYCLAGAAPEPVWANASARALAATRRDLPVVDGRPLADLVDLVLRTARAETLHGPLGHDGPTATVMARPLRVDGGPGVLLILEWEDQAGGRPWPGLEAHVVEKVQHSLLPPSLPLLPDLQLSGSYHRASSVRAAGGDWYDAVA